MDISYISGTMSKYYNEIFGGYLMKLNTLIMSLALFGFVSSTLPMQQTQETIEPVVTIENKEHIEGQDQVCACAACNGTVQTWKDTAKTVGVVIGLAALGAGLFYFMLQNETRHWEGYRARVAQLDPLDRLLERHIDHEEKYQIIIDAVRSLQTSNNVLQNTVGELSKKVASLAFLAK
jgi:hypothetical protein